MLIIKEIQMDKSVYGLILEAIFLLMTLFIQTGAFLLFKDSISKYLSQDAHVPDIFGHSGSHFPFVINGDKNGF